MNLEILVLLHDTKDVCLKVFCKVMIRYLQISTFPCCPFICRKIDLNQRKILKRRLNLIHLLPG